MAQVVSRARPDPSLVDGTIAQDNRFSGYKEPYMFSLKTKMYPLADEASYFVATNPTPGTGLTGHAAAQTMDNTKASVFILNQSPTGGRNIYLDYIKLVMTAAGTNGTSWYATHLIDQGAAYSSGGTAITPINPNLASGQRSVAAVYAGAAVVTAGTQRIVANQNVRTVIPVVGDVLLFTFGAEVPIISGMPLEGTTQLERSIVCPPVIVSPQGTYKLILWRASQTVAAAFEVEIGYWER
jgi:hypothetical protein